MTQRMLSFPISGMHCAGCEAAIETAVQELPGIDTVKADHIAKKVQVRFDEPLTSPSAILACIESKGYSYGIQIEKVSCFVTAVLWHRYPDSFVDLRYIRQRLERQDPKSIIGRVRYSGYSDGADDDRPRAQDDPVRL